VSGGGFPLHVALRYLRSARRDAFTSFLSAVAAGGIGLGVAALVVALAALSGMQRALREEILARTPSLAVTPPPGADPLDLERAIAREPEVVEVQRSLEGQGWVAAGGQALAVRIVGYQGAPPRSLPGAAGSVEGRAPGLYLSDRMAARIGIERGEVVQLASPRPSLTPLGPQPRLLSMRLEGVYRSGPTETEPAAALPLERAEILLGRGRAGRLLVTTRTLDEAPELAERLRASLPAGARVETWRELNRPLFLALTLERTVLFLAVSLIVAVAAMALFSDLQLVAATKRRELALLAAMGADERALRRAFVLLGALLGGGGAIAGGVLGAAAAAALDRWRLVRLPPGLLVFDSLPFHLEAGDVLAVVGVTLLLTLACARLGAARAARVVPAEALRG
jgi:lipoprotein-releasing system permease protein